MKISKIVLDTFITELPKLLNETFRSIENYIGVFYDPSRGVLQRPLTTTGEVRATSGRFITAVVDTLIVRDQFTNLTENSTTIDLDFYNSFTGLQNIPRAADPSLFENTAFSYFDVARPFYKIGNDSSLAFLTQQLGQEFQIIFDTSLATADPFNILLDPSWNGGIKVLEVDSFTSEYSWFKLIAIGYDPSWGTEWTIKQYGGDFTII